MVVVGSSVGFPWSPLYGSVSLGRELVVVVVVFSCGQLVISLVSSLVVGWLIASSSLHL